HAEIFPADAFGGANLRAADQWLSIPVVTGKTGVPAAGFAMGVPELASELASGTRFPGTSLDPARDALNKPHPASLRAAARAHPAPAALAHSCASQRSNPVL
ncbi:MAG: hypothetical protein U1C54_00955, partial [Xanthomonadaceae bacterium]|nr:hypothetical protein [Xanthomonadaceae bacterium]